MRFVHAHNITFTLSSTQRFSIWSCTELGSGSSCQRGWLGEVVLWRQEGKELGLFGCLRIAN